MFQIALMGPILKVSVFRMYLASVFQHPENNTENQACKKTSLRLSPQKVGKKKVKTMSSPLVLTFWSHSIVVTFPDKKQTELTFVHPKYVYRVYVLIFIRPVLRHISVNPSEFIFMISYWIIHNLLRQVWCSIIDLVPRSTYLYNINDYQR